MTYWVGAMLRELLLWHLLLCLTIIVGVAIHRAIHGNRRRPALMFAGAGATFLAIEPLSAFFGGLWGMGPLVVAGPFVGLLGLLFCFSAAASWLYAMWQSRFDPSGRWFIDVPVVMIMLGLGYLMIILPKPVPFLLFSLAT